MDHLAGWLLLLGGLAMLAMASLTPLWLEHRDLSWQQSVMREQTDRLLEQKQRYVDFHDALKRGEPVLLTRLAYQQFRLKPAGAQMLIDRPLAANRLGLASDVASVEAWLHVPTLQVGSDVLPPPPVQSHLVRLTTGLGRVVMLAVGIGCVAMGVMLNTSRGA